MTTETVNGQTRTVTRYRTVFDGFRYTHAVIVKFDSQGNLKWDETFEMWPAYKPFHVKRFISIAEKNEHQLKLVFASRSKITSQTVGFNGRIEKDFESETIETQYEGDKHKWTYSNIDYWYGRYFLAYGSAKIKNQESAKGDRKRKVFFISKVGY